MFRIFRTLLSEHFHELLSHRIQALCSDTFLLLEVVRSHCASDALAKHFVQRVHRAAHRASTVVCRSGQSCGNILCRRQRRGWIVPRGSQRRPHGGHRSVRFYTKRMSLPRVRFRRRRLRQGHESLQDRIGNGTFALRVPCSGNFRILCNVKLREGRAFFSADLEELVSHAAIVHVIV